MRVHTMARMGTDVQACYHDRLFSWNFNLLSTKAQVLT